MLTQATGRYIRVSPRKVRQVLRLIHGLDVPSAEAVLNNTNKGATHHVRKVLMAAVASAAQKQVEPEALKISKATADGGPIGKRFRAAPMGRAMRVRKRTCHLRIELEAVSLVAKTSKIQKAGPGKKG
ncbi:MAG: 50S ribosomal protein L22 [Candidatus Omnitrophica bacterium]|nr:50S ribosomal protein L22 [Candidatus Omnitrophota bacterium]